MQRLFRPFSLNIRGMLREFTRPQVMGIINVTPDSFYAGSRTQTDTDISLRVETLLEQGADMFDIGAYSSRPGADDVSAAADGSGRNYLSRYIPLRNSAYGYR